MGIRTPKPKKTAIKMEIRIETAIKMERRKPNWKRLEMLIGMGIMKPMEMLIGMGIMTGMHSLSRPG